MEDIKEEFKIVKVKKYNEQLDEERKGKIAKTLFLGFDLIVIILNNKWFLKIDMLNLKLLISTLINYVFINGITYDISDLLEHIYKSDMIEEQITGLNMTDNLKKLSSKEIISKIAEQKKCLEQIHINEDDINKKTSLTAKLAFLADVGFMIGLKSFDSPLAIAAIIFIISTLGGVYFNKIKLGKSIQEKIDNQKNYDNLELEIKYDNFVKESQRKLKR